MLASDLYLHTMCTSVQTLRILYCFIGFLSVALVATVVSIEDSHDQDDWDGWATLTGSTDIQIVGDDLTVTHPKRYL